MITLTDEEYARLKEMADYQIPRKPSWDSDGCEDGHNVWEIARICVKRVR